ncbi:MAG: hypothetical protein KBT69_10955, partial [Oceanihabitans sp.]|nr:hypothetical protein [Oceanihabitans sp.]
MYDNLPFNVKDSSTINAFLMSGLLKQISETVDYCKETGEQFTNKITYKYYNLNFTLTYSRKNTYNELYCKGSFHYLM